jgi:hypothetical protein
VADGVPKMLAGAAVACWGVDEPKRGFVAASLLASVLVETAAGFKAPKRVFLFSFSLLLASDLPRPKIGRLVGGSSSGSSRPRFGASLVAVEACADCPNMLAGGVPVFVPLVLGWSEEPLLLAVIPNIDPAGCEPNMLLGSSLAEDPKVVSDALGLVMLLPKMDEVETLGFAPKIELDVAPMPAGAASEALMFPPKRGFAGVPEFLAPNIDVFESAALFTSAGCDVPTGGFAPNIEPLVAAGPEPNLMGVVAGLKV